ncbi:MAG: hypothetical protein JWN48_463 [Myxococcaceae bacterium]|nr:hypothetical protein [Myxococcaceae bacterium]
MSLYDASVPQYKRMLNNLDKWFDKLEAYAKSRNFDPAVLLTYRLAPDQLHFTRQIQIACDSAKLGSARLAGKQAPSHADDESSIADLRARIKSTIAFLDTLTPADFEGAETRKVTAPGAPGKLALGRDNLFEHALPNFYFHLTTAYAILRHNGVDLGKSDFLGVRTVQDA